MYIPHVTIVLSEVIESSVKKCKLDFLPRRQYELVVSNFTEDHTIQLQYSPKIMHAQELLFASASRATTDACACVLQTELLCGKTIGARTTLRRKDLRFNRAGERTL